MDAEIPRDLLPDLLWKFHLDDQFYSPEDSGTKNGDIEPYKAVLGVGFPLRKPYIQLT